MKLFIHILIQIMFVFVFVLFAEQQITFRSHHKFELTYPSSWHLDSSRIEDLEYLDEDLNSRTLIISNYLPSVSTAGKTFNKNDIKIDINIRKLNQDSIQNYKEEVRKTSNDSILINGKLFYIRKEKDDMVAAEGVIDTITTYIFIGKGLVFNSCYFPGNSTKMKKFMEIIGSINIKN
jgi:hypothetical protein